VGENYINGNTLGMHCVVWYDRAMFRTRDFLLFFIAAVFMLVAIGATVLSRHFSSVATTPSVQLVEMTEEQAFTVEIVPNETISREDRLEAMRRKIAEGGALTISTPVQTEGVAAVTEEVMVVSDNAVTPIVMKCPQYKTYQQPWRTEGIEFAVSEGVRTVYRISKQPINEVSASSSSTVDARTVLLQLPIQPFITTPTCISGDVIGVAHDGSLIRNEEAGLYGVFGEGTMIGYALDGHSIYGTSDITTDSCGGTMIGGEYRYYLSSERATIVNCFTASPISL